MIFVAKSHPIRHTRGAAPVAVVGPTPGQADLPIDQRVTARGGVSAEHPDLGVLDPAGGAGVLALHPDTTVTLLQITGVIDDQHSGRVTHRVDHVPAHVIAHLVGVPDRLTQQSLHALRRAVPGLLGHLPARPGFHIGQQSEQERPRSSARFHPSEPARDPGERGVELLQPPAGVYAGPSGRR